MGLPTFVGMTSWSHLAYSGSEGARCVLKLLGVSAVGVRYEVLRYFRWLWCDLGFWPTLRSPAGFDAARWDPLSNCLVKPAVPWTRGLQTGMVGVR